MALVYDKYFKIIPSSYKITGAVPIDLRQVVQDLSNLYGPISQADHTWEDSKGNLVTFNGMIVSVQETQEVYMCINESFPYEATSWKKVGGSNATITAVTIGEYPGYITVDDKKIAVEEINSKYFRVDQDDPREEINPSIITFVTVYAESEHTTGSDEKGIVIDNTTVHEAGTYIKVEDEDGNISYSKINIDALLQKIQELQVVINDVSSRLDNTIVDLNTFKEYVDTSLDDIKNDINETVNIIDSSIDIIDISILELFTSIDKLTDDVVDVTGVVEDLVNEFIDVSARVDELESNTVKSVNSSNAYVTVNPMVGHVSIGVSTKDAEDTAQFPSSGLVTDGYVEERLDVFNWVEVENE